MRSFSLAYASTLVAAVCLLVAACSSDDAAPAPASGVDSGAADAPRAPDEDGSTSSDAGTEPDSGTPVAAPEGSLEAKTAGALATTAKLGVFTPKRGVAVWRPSGNTTPTVGGVLTVWLEEDTAASPSRFVELALYDDTDTLTAGESWNGEPKSGVAPVRRARVETYQSDGKGWRADGDGTVTLRSIDATSVSLELANMGQFTFGAGTDVFTLSGTVKVALATPASAIGSAATLTIANQGNEPIGGDPLNLTAQATAVSAPSTTVSEVALPYLGSRRVLELSDTVSGVERTVRVTFPSGHFPRAVQDLSLAKFDRVTVALFEGPELTETSTTKLWEADQGSVVVAERSATSITLNLVGARMQSESPSAKGVFTLDGSLTFPLP